MSNLTDDRIAQLVHGRGSRAMPHEVVALAMEVAKARGVTAAPPKPMVDPSEPEKPLTPEQRLITIFAAQENGIDVRYDQESRLVRLKATGEPWNPYYDGSTALVLAVKLGMTIEAPDSKNGPVGIVHYFNTVEDFQDGVDSFNSVCAAITIAAATPLMTSAAAYIAGFAAYQSEDTNPHQDGTDDHMLWTLGLRAGGNTDF